MTTRVDTEKEIKSGISKASQALLLQYPEILGYLFIYLLKHIYIKEHYHKTQDKDVQRQQFKLASDNGAESWKKTKTISQKLEVFQNRCLLTRYSQQLLTKYNSNIKLRTLEHLQTYHTRSETTQLEVD